MDPVSLVAALDPSIGAAQPEWKMQRKALRRRFEDEVRGGLADHHGYVTRSCQERHRVSLATAPVDALTIELLFLTAPRRLGMSSASMNDQELLTAPVPEMPAALAPSALRTVDNQAEW